MTTSEAAQALGIDRSRVLLLIKQGRINAERHGRDWWIAPDEVERVKSIPRPQGRPPKISSATEAE